MGMSTDIVGVRALDEGLFSKMIKLKHACEAANTEYPKELTEYFDGYHLESEDFLRNEMEQIDIDNSIDEYSEEMTNVWEVDLSLLPEEVVAIRFRNCY